MADQVAPARAMTLQEFELQYLGKRYEFLDGRAVPMGPEIVTANGEVTVTPTKPQHALNMDEIQFRTGQFVREHDLERVFGAEMGFLMDTDPPQMRALDVAFVSHARLAGVDLRQWFPFPPDLAVEVVSEYDKATDIRRKAVSHMERGTRLLLVVHPDAQLIDVYRPGQPVPSLCVGDTLNGGDALPGFRLDIGQLFAALSP